MKTGLFIGAIITIIHLQFSSQSCHTQETCKQCIRNANCAWCSEENFKLKADSRCDTEKNLKKLGCPVSNITNPSSTLEYNKKIGVGPSVQVSPQKVTLKLRPGKPVAIPLVVRSAENYPVDLYYLMDMSWSMKDDLGNLKKLAGRIAQTMENITKNYQLGFGSFVDKTLTPFISGKDDGSGSIDVKPVDCRRGLVSCEHPYGFHHILKLNKNSTKFETEVNRQIISYNNDDPEGGLDGLMQVAVCGDRIGWKKIGESRRIVVFVTDAPFHAAGDGKLGGVTTPNDGECHLDANGYYDKSLQFDYPSMAEMLEKLQQNRIQPIFAVTQAFTDLYKELSLSWDYLGATSGVLDKDSGNVVKLIQDSYDKIASTVKLAVKPPQGIRVEYTGQCGNKIVSNGECTNVTIKQKVDFDISVVLERCTDEIMKQKSFTIRVPGFGQLEVDLEFICNCPCESPSFRVENSSKCSDGNGTYACGQCSCYEDRYGESCECDSPFDKSKDLSKCKATNVTDEPLCSGHGQCVCAKCVCNRDPRGRIYGEYCQCDDFSCQKHKGQVCGGPDHGVCDCGVCKCKGFYIGDNCGQRNCSLLDFECRKDKETDLCGGKQRGYCECGQCKCDSKYTGPFCEDCPTCEGGICSRSKTCIACTKFDKKSLEDCKKVNRCEPIIQSVETIQNIKTYTDMGLYHCEGSREKCTYYFTYKKRPDGKTYDLLVQEKQACPPPAPILAISLGVVGGILLIGLLLLLIAKILFSVSDRMEYKRFERDRMHAKWTKEKNPLYKDAKTTFQNPTYAGE